MRAARSALHRCLVSVLGLALIMSACGDGDSIQPDANATPDVVEDVTWSQDMTKEELLEVLLKLGVFMSPEASREEVIATLEQKTGCGCFGAVCGTGYCDHQCGSCGENFSCFSGSCITELDCRDTLGGLSDDSALLRNNLETYQFRYEAIITGEEFDMLKITSNTAIEQALGAGTYDLRLQDISACELCVRAYKGCSNGVCAETYVARAGQVTLEGAIGSPTFKGTMKHLRFEQAYEDPKTGNVYIFPKPQARCVPEMSFDVPTDTVVVEPTDCDPEGTGVTIGSSIGDFELLNCYGDPVRFHDGCGQKAVWVVAVAGW